MLTDCEVCLSLSKTCNKNRSTNFTSSQNISPSGTVSNTLTSTDLNEEITFYRSLFFNQKSPQKVKFITNHKKSTYFYNDLLLFYSTNCNLQFEDLTIELFYAIINKICTGEYLENVTNTTQSNNFKSNIIQKILYLKGKNQENALKDIILTLFVLKTIEWIFLNDNKENLSNFTVEKGISDHPYLSDLLSNYYIKSVLSKKLTYGQIEKYDLLDTLLVLNLRDCDCFKINLEYKEEFILNWLNSITANENSNGFSTESPNSCNSLKLVQISQCATKHKKILSCNLQYVDLSQIKCNLSGILNGTVDSSNLMRYLKAIIHFDRIDTEILARLVTLLVKFNNQGTKRLSNSLKTMKMTQKQLNLTQNAGFFTESDSTFLREYISQHPLFYESICLFLEVSGVKIKKSALLSIFIPNLSQLNDFEKIVLESLIFMKNTEISDCNERNRHLYKNLSLLHDNLIATLYILQKNDVLLDGFIKLYKFCAFHSNMNDFTALDGSENRKIDKKNFLQIFYVHRKSLLHRNKTNTTLKLFIV